MTKRNPKGAGRKPISKKYSDALKTDIFKALKKKADESKQTIGDVIVELAYSSKKEDFNVRPVALRMIQDILLIKETQSTSDINVAKTEGPVICLPPLDPSLTTPPKKEDEKGMPLH